MTDPTPEARLRDLARCQDGCTDGYRDVDRCDSCGGTGYSENGRALLEMLDEQPNGILDLVLAARKLKAEMEERDD